MFYSGSRSKLGKPTVYDGSESGQNLPTPTAYYDASYPQTVTLVSGAISQLNDFNGNGNNATQGTAANRPLLSRADNKENRVLDSNVTAMGAGIWGVTRATFESGTTITAGGQTIRFIKEDATAGNTHFLITGTYLPIVSGVTYRISLTAYSTNRGLQVWCLDGLGSTSAYINLTTGASVSLGAGISAFQATDLGSGVYRYTFLVTATSTALSRLSLQLTNPASSTTSSYNGDNTSGAYIGAVQVQVATASSEYLATTTFPQYAGINGNAVPVFDGSNDSLATTIAVNPTGGMWGAAVLRPNSLATNAIVMADPVGASSRIAFYSNTGGALQLRVYNGNTVYIGRAAPNGTIVAGETAVVSFTYDGSINATGIKVYKNGVQVDTTSVTAGVYAVPTAGGNLYIGSDSNFNWCNGYVTPAVFGQGSTWADADRQATERDLMNKYIPNYVWFNPANNVTSDAGAVASWTDVTNTYVASQSTAANRPLVSRTDNQENRLTYSEQLDNAAWVLSGSTISANAITAPDGTLTADKIVETATTAAHRIISPSFAPVAGALYRASAYLKAGERTIGYIRANNGATDANAFFNLSTGVASNASNCTPSIEAVGDGWYRCIIEFTLNGVTTSNLYINAIQSIPTTSYTGDGTSGIYAWGAQVHLASTSSTYLATTTTPQYAGLNNQQAFLYDGSNDSLATNLAVNPTGGMAGVVVVRPSTIAVDGAILGARNASASDRLMFLIASPNGTILTRIYNGSANFIGRTTPNSTVVANETAVYSFTYDGGTLASGIKIYKNGVQVDNADSTSGSYTLPTAGLVLSIGEQNSGNRFNGYIADAFFVQGRQMSDSERQGWESRFMEKYGI